VIGHRVAVRDPQAGTRLLAYQARSGRWQRGWMDEAECGFWRWCQRGDVVVMSAELELAAGTTDGNRTPGAP
jgi:hypothetical protein